MEIANYLAVILLTFPVLCKGQYINFSHINDDDTQKLNIADAGDEFGKSMAASGNYLVVASAKDDEGGKTKIGSVALFAYNGTSLVLETKIVPHNGEANDRFGTDVALENDLLIVGSKQRDLNPLSTEDNQGSAYIYRKNGTNWNFETILESDIALIGQKCGCTVAVKNALVYMACGGDSVAGSVHVFQYSSSTWSRITKINSPDGQINDGFGNAIAIDNNYVVLAADIQQVVYIYRKVGNSLAFEKKLTGDVPTPYLYFGKSLSLSDNRLVVGTEGSLVGGGFAYIYSKNDSGWFEETKLSTPHSTPSNDLTFGRVVLLTQKVLFVSSPEAKLNGTKKGSTYIYKLVNETWDLQVTWIPSVLNANDYFGCDLAYVSNVLVAGASRADDNGSRSGVAYYRQVYYTPTNFSYTCHQNYFEVRFAQQILSEYWYEITMTDLTCNSTSASNETYVWYKSDYSQCGTSIAYTDTNISMANSLTVTNRYLLRGISVRQESHKYNIKCTFNRQFDVYPENNDAINVAIGNSIVTKTNETIENFQVEYSMATYTTSSFQTATTTPLIVSTNQLLYVGIKEKTSNANFKFVVNRCYASMTQGGKDDMFFNNKCPLDPTFQLISNTNDEYNFAISAFYFTGNIETPIYLNCWIFVCHNTTGTADCTQTCTKRKRRATIMEKKIEIADKSIMITSNKIILRKPISCEVMSCKANSNCYNVGIPKCICITNYVFSKKDNRCINEGLFIISGLHLDKTWSSEYSNKLSRPFLKFSSEIEEVLTLLLSKSDKSNTIMGIKVISVVKIGDTLALDIMLTCNNSKSSDAISKAFLNSIMTKSTATRELHDTLKIVKKKIPFLKINSFVHETPINLKIVLILVPAALVVLTSGLFVLKFFFLKYSPLKV